jgi:hypothetical protein
LARDLRNLGFFIKRSQIVMVDNQHSDFDRAFDLLCELVDFEEADKMFAQRAHTVFTASVVLWMLVYQRLKPDTSLENTVKHLLETRPQLLPKNKRLTEGNISTRSGTYSVARKRLPLKVVKWFADEACDRIVATTEPSWNDRRVFLVDGTTIALAPEGELQEAFPPASNQMGEGVWPIAILTVFHELASGCALLPEIGPMYGDNAVSETKLACQGIAKLPRNSILIGDKGFGIFGVAYETKRSGHDFLFRMKKANFNSLRKNAELISKSSRHKSYQYCWQPTKKNRLTNPNLPEDASLHVWLHEVEVTDNLTLYLATTLEDDAWSLSGLFEYRYNVEIDIRNFKVVLGAENIRAKSVDTFLKELYTSVVAYNLTSQFRREAAALNKLPPRRMSFKRTWTTFQTFLLRHMHTDPARWREAFERALAIAKNDTLPNRSGRSFKREAYRKRPKDVQFAKRQKPPSKIRTSDLK